MNNSAEAENPNQKLFNYLSNEHGVDLMENELHEIVRIVAPIVLEKELSELTDEVIEEIVIKAYPYSDIGNVGTYLDLGAKALRDYLKQNNLKK